MGYPRRRAATSIASGAVADGPVTFNGDVTLGSSAQLFLPDGTASDPPIAFSSDPDTGLYYASSTMRLGFGGANKLTIAAVLTPQVQVAMDGLLTMRVSVGLTASTTQAQGQGALSAAANVFQISTCANANDTVTLPAATAGQGQIALVINDGAQTLQVFPASGDNLGAGADTATTITAGSRKLFVAFDATNWEPVV